MKYTYWESVREKRAKQTIWMLSLIIAALITGIVSWKINVAAQERTQKELAEEILRFHVLANSDSDADQQLKMQVKDALLAYMEAQMPETAGVEETGAWARTHTEDLERIGREVVAEKGYDYPVNAAVTTCYFPDKDYAGVTFPAGNYTALRVEIGEAGGHNWWSVLYPNLSFMDAVHIKNDKDGKTQVGNVFAEEDEKLADTEIEIKWYFSELLSKKKTNEDEADKT